MNLGGYTARGPREVNEDSFYVFEFPADAKLSGGINSFVLVSDGMGGYQGGDVASGLTVACARSYIGQLAEMAQSNWVELDAPAALAEIARNAHEAIVAHAREHGTPQMGATFVGAFVGGAHAWIGHIGDSRAYLVRDGVALQLTEDHSHVGRLLSRGVITEEEAQNHPERNRIERALGFSDGNPDQNEVDLEEGDALLLCSDGVYTVLDAAMLGSCVSRAHDAQAAAQQVVERALKRGSDDNSTAVVLMSGEPAAVDETHVGMLPATARRRPLQVSSVSEGDGIAREGSEGRPLPWATIVPIALLVLLSGIMIALFLNSGTGAGGSASGDGAPGAASQAAAPEAGGSAVAEGQEAPQPIVPTREDDTSETSQEQGSQTQPSPTATSYETFVTTGQTSVKYLDETGVAQAFDQDPLYMTESLSIDAGVSVEASATSDSYGRMGRSYQLLPDSYLQGLKRDLQRYAEGSTSFDSSFSRLFDAREYLEFVAELSEYGQDRVATMVSHLLVDSTIDDVVPAASETSYGTATTNTSNAGDGQGQYGIQDEPMPFGQ